MAIEQTLSIIKPDAVSKQCMGAIISCFEKNNLQIVAAKMLHLSQLQAEQFYAIHRQKPFFNDLVAFMSSGPVLVMILQGEQAIMKNRELMGATNPKEALPHTIRGQFATSIDHNAVHGSDAPDTAKQEIAFFFTSEEIVR